MLQGMAGSPVGSRHVYEAHLSWSAVSLAVVKCEVQSQVACVCSSIIGKICGDLSFLEVSYKAGGVHCCEVRGGTTSDRSTPRQHALVVCYLAIEDVYRQPFATHAFTAPILAQEQPALRTHSPRNPRDDSTKSLEVDREHPRNHPVWWRFNGRSEQSHARISRSARERLEAGYQ